MDDDDLGEADLAAARGVLLSMPDDKVAVSVEASKHLCMAQCERILAATKEARGLSTNHISFKLKTLSISSSGLFLFVLFTILCIAIIV